jgi:hypothetical protein
MKEYLDLPSFANSDLVEEESMEERPVLETEGDFA